jgi:hypothetical protein
MNRFFIAATSALALASVATSALAQEGDKTTARELAAQGAAALNRHDWAEAEDRFRRADAVYHAPTLTLGLARAEAHEGKVVEAWENYHRILYEHLTTSPTFAKALEEAKAEIKKVESERARLTIHVTGAPSPTVKVNDAELRGEFLDVARYVNPGTHVVTATADGFEPATMTLSIAGGQEQTVALALDTPSAAPPPAVHAAGGPASEVKAAKRAALVAPHDDARGSQGSALRPIGIVAISIGGAGLLLGGVTGGLAIATHGNLASECPGGGCASSSGQADLSKYRTMGTLSTIGFVVGGAGIVSGVAFLLATPAGPKPTATASVRPVIGLGSIGVAGAF